MMYRLLNAIVDACVIERSLPGMRGILRNLSVIASAVSGGSHPYTGPTRPRRSNTLLSVSTGWLGLCLILCANAVLAAPVGLTTRDQNPMFQAFYLPSIDLNAHQGWQVLHSAYLSSVFQNKRKGSERLILDVENYRYDFSIAYQQDKWRLSATLPLLFNESGIFDGAIEDWHDLFGMSQGGRQTLPRNQFNISYSRNGELFFSQTQTTNDIGDLSASLSYSLVHSAKIHRAMSLAIELPTGSKDNISGNGAVDVALWLSQSYEYSKRTDLYGLFGLSLPGKGGQLARLQESAVWVTQIGLEHQYDPDWSVILQLDAHSAFIKDSQLKALGDSYQLQFGLRLREIMQDHDIDLFFSEDIRVGSAPDITIGVKLYRQY